MVHPHTNCWCGMATTMSRPLRKPVAGVPRYDGTIGVGVKPKTAQARVLIVDDEEDLCWTLTKILEDLNYQVVCAHTAKTALQHLQKDRQKDKPIRLTLLDVRLPDMGEAGGLELLKKIKRLKARMPVIVMSAFGATAVKTTARRLGALAFLDKPFRIEKLLKLIRERLG